MGSRERYETSRPDPAVIGRPTLTARRGDHVADGLTRCGSTQSLPRRYHWMDFFVTVRREGRHPACLRRRRSTRPQARGSQAAQGILTLSRTSARSNSQRRAKVIPRASSRPAPHTPCSTRKRAMKLALFQRARASPNAAKLSMKRSTSAEVCWTDNIHCSDFPHGGRKTAPLNWYSQWQWLKRSSEARKPL